MILETTVHWATQSNFHLRLVKDIAAERGNVSEKIERQKTV